MGDMGDMGDPNRSSTESRFKPMTMALAGIALVAALITLLPANVRPWNLSAIGALGLFDQRTLRS